MSLPLTALLNPALFTDSYKLSHKAMEPAGTEIIYANFTPRSNKYFQKDYPTHDGKTVVFGIYPFLLDFLQTAWNDHFFARPKQEVMDEIRNVTLNYVGMDTPDLQHFAELHDLGYLPIRVKALPEGSLAKPNLPVLTIVNTHKSFSWLTNYLESVLSSELWKPMTIATAAREFNTLADYWFEKTVVDMTYRHFAIHDFSYRGHGTHREAAICGAAPLLFSNGTDNIPGLLVARTMYGAGNDVAASVAASEHSVTTLGINFYATKEITGELKTLTDQLLNRMIALGIQDEYEKAFGELVTMYRLLTEVYPTGIFSYVADSYDYWRTLTIIVPILKDVILRRDGKLVIRPDSGDPVKMVCGYSCDSFDHKDFIHTFRCENFGNEAIKVAGKYYKHDLHEEGGSIDHDQQLSEEEVKGSIEILSEIFGFSTNEKGYKELPPQIGLIYGDGITYQRGEGIYSGLVAKGFASNNVILGVGSYSFAGGTRDTLGFAIKATYAEVGGTPVPIYKEPKTDLSKKSARGLMKVVADDTGELQLVDQVSWEEEAGGLLQLVFEDGQLYNQPIFKDIRTRLGFYK